MVFTLMYCFVFFFQAEDGIRDKLVTGVQTCALPICHANYHYRRAPQFAGVAELCEAALQKKLCSSEKSFRQANDSHCIFFPLDEIRNPTVREGAGGDQVLMRAEPTVREGAGGDQVLVRSETRR